MKKPRRHTAKHNGRRAHKRATPDHVRPASTTALATTADVTRNPSRVKNPALQVALPPSASHANDAWRWHNTSSGPTGHRSGDKKRRAKGPPPPKPTRNSIAATAPPRSATKLSPALVARQTAPLPPPIAPVLVWQAARQRLSTAWRADRMAAVMLLLPTLLTAALLAALPKVKAPLEQTSLVASLKLKQAPAYVRPPERMAPAVMWAQHDLAAVVRSLSRDIADLTPPFHRPAEALVLSVPMAQHDLASVAAALARDVDAARPPFHRPAEALATYVAKATHDLAVVVPSLAHDADTARLAFVKPNKMPPETLAALAIEAQNQPAMSIETPAALTCRAPAAFLEARSSKRTGIATALLPLNPDAALAGDPLRFGRALAKAAKEQTQDLVVYNARYMQIAYPRGDVPALFGVCTDVVIRAYRALDIDLQELVHQSRAGPADKSIDHRRTELLRKFFATHGEQLAVSPYSEDYLPGDIVTYYRPQNKSSTAHIAVVTDEISRSGRPMIAHNRGWGVQLEDALFVDQMTGHYRFRGLDATAVAALPRNVLMAAAGAAKRPAVRIADAARGRAPAQPASASTDCENAALLVPPMALGALAKSAASRTAQARCTAAVKLTAVSCRPANGNSPQP